MKPTTKLLKLHQIVTDAGTQIRAKLDEDTVAEYALSMQDASNKFPPVIVFHDGKRFVLADGFHRVMAAARNNFWDIEAAVRKGSRADALTFALGANSNHGLKRTNADKRNSVELALSEWPDISDRQLSTICAVSNTFVGLVRAQLSTVDSSDPAAKRLGSDNKRRNVPVKPAKPPVTPDPEPPSEAQRNDAKFKAALGGKVPSVPDDGAELARHLDAFESDLLAMIKAIPHGADLKAYVSVLQRQTVLVQNRLATAKNARAYL